MALPVLKRGATGEAVERWQQFLIGHGFPDLVADGKFGKATEDASKTYQASKGLLADGVIGGKTYAKALEDGFDGVQYDADFPPKPAFPAVVSLSERQQLFGKFDYVSDPTPNNPERVKILGGWVNENILEVELVDFQNIAGAPGNGKMQFHRLAAPQLQALWKAWKSKDLLKFILTFDGSFVPRFIRGSRTVLSNHAFGSAFDINYEWNKLSHTPALVGAKGSVRLLVPIANEYGFYWGGHFNSRKDGMHFEVARILSDEELQTLANKYGI
ncbi:M15 family metallopeptidase [Pannus brasiliensis CCIBt3594]|uniref:M15 family metallopeptidase n=1 Tax=Pannus brasiliensis CCIBt3594 TaxID=1427578 RepID=A0AAW9QVM0_9CHRO